MDSYQDSFVHLTELVNQLSMERQEHIWPDRFPDLFEQIFGYLDTKSLCNASLVCTSWNEFISNSSNLMKNVRVCIDLSKGTESHQGNIFDILAKSNRLFKSIKIKLFITSCPEIKVFMDKHQWTEIILDCQCVEFPKLSPVCLEKTKTIEINTLDIILVQNLLLSVPNLKHLKLTLSTSKSCDWTILQNLQLTSLTLSLSLGVSFPARKVNEFIKSQMHQLQSLDLQGIAFNEETMSMIMTMPCLKSLVLQKLFFEMNLSTFEFEEMKNLEKLSIRHESPAMNQMTYSLLWSTPNLKYLDIPVLDQSWIVHAGYRLKLLEELHIGEFNDFSNISSPDIFPELVKIKIRKRMTSNIKRRIEQQVEEDLTNFKLCLYEETSKKPHILQPMSIRYF